MNERPNQRKELLSDRTYQLRFATRVFATVFAVALISSLISSNLLWLNMYRPELGPNTVLIGALMAVASTLAIELILSIPLVFFLSIRQSHRIVGPMNRLKQTLEAIGRGDFSQRITIRHDDALEDLANTINRMAENLQQRSPRT